MKKDQKIDLLVLILIPLLTASGLLLCRANFLVSTVFLFGIPSFYLFLKNKKVFKKVFLFSLICSIPVVLLFDYLIVKDNGWYIINTIFSFRLFNLVVIEQFLWGFCWFFYVVSFYEYFLNNQKHRSLLSFLPFFKKTDVLITKRMEYLAMFAFAGLLFFIFLVFFRPNFLTLNYAYLALSIVLVVIPLVIFLFKFPNFLTRFLWVAVYFSFLSIIIEYVGLKLNHWAFPGTHFLGMINFFGFRVPYEETIMYFVLFAPSALAYYEFFDDDRK